MNTCVKCVAFYSAPTAHICFCFPVLMLARMACAINVTVTHFYKVHMLYVAMMLSIL